MFYIIIIWKTFTDIVFYVPLSPESLKSHNIFFLSFLSSLHSDFSQTALQQFARFDEATFTAGGRKQTILLQKKRKNIKKKHCKI